MNQEKLAILDLGTNTFHLLIAEMNERDEFVVKEKYKIPVKLGEGGITEGKITDRAFDRGIKALKRIRKLIDSKKANKVFAFATSAIRSSSNGKEFVQRAKKEIGIEIKVINGNEEAALIFEGVRNGVHLPYDRESLLIDIGGGSVEFIVSRENKPLLLRSLDIGAARLLELFDISDPMKEEQIREIRSYLRKQMAGLLTELREFDLSLLVGSSGSFETVATLIANNKNDTISAENINNYTYRRSDFLKTYRQLIASTHAERSAMPGMEPMRVDMIVMGAIIIDVVMKELKLSETIISVFALKEGIFYRYIQEKKERVNYLIGNSAKNLRAKAVRNTGKKYGIDLDHGLKVSELSVMLFDALKTLHNLGDSEREIIRYAAILHDVGYFISRSGHHKHGQYIVMNSGLNGFSSDELLLMGTVIRYHRKSLPSRDHFHFKLLSPAHRIVVRTLAGILRISDHLDRGHRGLVDGIWTKVDRRGIHIFVESSEVVDLEISAALENKELIEQVFNLKVSIEQI